MSFCLTRRKCREPHHTHKFSKTLLRSTKNKETYCQNGHRKSTELTKDVRQLNYLLTCLSLTQQPGFATIWYRVSLKGNPNDDPDQSWKITGHQHDASQFRCWGTTQGSSRISTLDSGQKTLITRAGQSQLWKNKDNF